MAEKILRRKAVLEKLGVSSATLHRRIHDGSFPPPLRLGPNSVGWRESTVEEIIDGYQTADPVPVAPGARRARKPRSTSTEV